MPAAWAYFDTSVLVKRYVKEPGSSIAAVLLRKHRILSSALAPLEAVSAFSRRLAAGELEEEARRAILERLRADCQHWELVEVSPLVLERAEALIQDTGLRTLDAIHVASALFFQAASGIRIPFVTADAVQRKAAREMSLEVVRVS